MDDPRFWALREALASYASDPDDPPVGDDDLIHAAVSVVLRGRDDLDLLLIKRAAHEGDPWSGHMALPGGRAEPDDDSLTGTAIRETHEETGVDLDTRGHVLGRLERVAPVSARLPRITISPFVFGVEDDTSAAVASPEVAAVHWVGLDELRNPDTSGTVDISVPGGGSRAFPCFRVAGEVVWGLTWRILTDFFDVYPEEELARLAASTPPTPR